jgi:hypothetical protein
MDAQLHVELLTLNPNRFHHHFQEGNMIYVVTVEFADQNMEDYHRVKQGYADDPIDGLVAQVAGVGDDGLRIVGIWESKAQHDRWVTERLHPSFERYGHPGAMTFTEFLAEDLLRGPAPSLAGSS